MSGHIKQRTRWTIGNIQTARKLNFRLWGPLVLKCTLRQRLAGFLVGAGSTINSTLAVLGFLSVPLALLSGYPLVVYGSTYQLRWLLRLSSLWVIIDWSYKASLSLFIGYRNGMRWDQAEAWLIPCKFSHTGSNHKIPNSSRLHHQLLP